MIDHHFVIILFVEFCPLTFVYIKAFISSNVSFLHIFNSKLSNFSQLLPFHVHMETHIYAACRVIQFYRHVLLIESIVDIFHLCISIAKIKLYSTLWKQINNRTVFLKNLQNFLMQYGLEKFGEAEIRSKKPQQIIFVTFLD